MLTVLFLHFLCWKPRPFAEHLVQFLPGRGCQRSAPWVHMLQTHVLLKMWAMFLLCFYYVSL